MERLKRLSHYLAKKLTEFTTGPSSEVMEIAFKEDDIKKQRIEKMPPQPHFPTDYLKLADRATFGGRYPEAERHLQLAGEALGSIESRSYRKQLAVEIAGRMNLPPETLKGHGYLFLAWNVAFSGDFESAAKYVRRAADLYLANVGREGRWSSMPPFNLEGYFGLSGFACDMGEPEWAVKFLSSLGTVSSDEEREALSQQLAEELRERAYKLGSPPLGEKWWWEEMWPHMADRARKVGARVLAQRYTLAADSLR